MSSCFQELLSLEREGSILMRERLSAVSTNITTKKVFQKVLSRRLQDAATVLPLHLLASAQEDGSSSGEEDAREVMPARRQSDGAAAAARCSIVC
jgi:hypothetical protein